MNENINEKKMINKMMTKTIKKWKKNILTWPSLWLQVFHNLSPCGSNAHSARKLIFRTTQKNNMTNLRPQPPSKIGSTHASNWLQQMNHSPLPNSAWSSQNFPGLLHLRECTSRSSAWHQRRRNPPGEAVRWQFTPIMSQLCKYPLNGPLQAIEMGKVKFFTNEGFPTSSATPSAHLHLQGVQGTCTADIFRCIPRKR